MSKKWLIVVKFLSVVLVTDLIRRHILPSTVKTEKNYKDFGSLGDLLEKLGKWNSSSKKASGASEAERVENVLQINKNNNISDDHTEGKTRINEVLMFEFFL